MNLNQYAPSPKRNQFDEFMAPYVDWIEDNWGFLLECLGIVVLGAILHANGAPIPWCFIVAMWPFILFNLIMAIRNL
jgi:hypothetical protein